MTSWRRSPQPALAYVVAPQNRGWVLDGMCRDIDRHTDLTTCYHYGEGPLPRAHAYFFSHYSLFVREEARRRVRRARSLVFFTHPSDPPLGDRACIKSLNHASRVIAMSSASAAELVQHGVASDRIEVIIPGVDPVRFRSHQRSNRGIIGFSSAYYPRKNPEAILAIVRAAPHLQFRLLGRDWPAWDGFHEALSLRNLEYLEADLSAYPDFYDSLDVFVSPSRLEGGPIPLLEAMMCNVVPVATKTGFAPDLIEHGANGYLVEVDAGPEEYVRYIEAALGREDDIRGSVRHLTPAAFSRSVTALLRP